jgi:hypothetical protein
VEKVEDGGIAHVAEYPLAIYMVAEEFREGRIETDHGCSMSA